MKLKDILKNCAWCGGILEEGNNHPHCRSRLKHWASLDVDTKKTLRHEKKKKK